MKGKIFGCLVAAISVPVGYVVQVNYCKQTIKHKRQVSEQFVDKSNNDYKESNHSNKFQSDNSSKLSKQQIDDINYAIYLWGSAVGLAFMLEFTPIGLCIEFVAAIYYIIAHYLS